MYDEEYYCPNCGAILNNQSGFDPDLGDWECAECGQHLYGDDVEEGIIYPGVIWHCDMCGALLNKQVGFSDIYGTWICTECGYENDIDDDNIYGEGDYHRPSKLERFANFLGRIADSVSDEASESDNEEDEEFSESDQERMTVEETEQEEAKAERLRREESENAERIARHNKWKRLKAFFLSRKRIDIGYSSDDLVGQPVDAVVDKLTKSGFTKVGTQTIKDVYPGSRYYLGEVDTVIIDDSTDFVATDRFRYSAVIKVIYHEKKELAISVSDRNAKKLTAGDLSAVLKEDGFTQIRLLPQYDLTTGWIKKSGAIVKVTVADSENFKEGTIFPFDAPIEIIYHDFKRNQPKS